MQNKPNQAVVILGMHRSGTSVLAGMLTMLGIYPGENLVPAHTEVNPKGFWEHSEIVDLNDQLLRSLGSCWEDFSALPDLWWKKPEMFPFRSKLAGIVRRDFENSPLWLLKDPRLCRLLPLWLDILQDLGCKPYFIICLRNPVEVGASLKKRDGFLDGDALLLWLRYVLDAERWSRNYSRIFVTYESVLKDWQSLSNTLQQGMDVKLRSEDAEAIRKINEFIEPDLRHHVSRNNLKPQGKISELALKVYNLVTKMPDENSAKLLLECGDQLDGLCSLILPWATQNVQLRKWVKDLRLHNTWQQSELKRIKSTMSWRVTKPLRFCAFVARRIFKMKT